MTVAQQQRPAACKSELRSQMTLKKELGTLKNNFNHRELKPMHKNYTPQMYDQGNPVKVVRVSKFEQRASRACT